jgi:DNA-binding IclR family transcriptional regulator
MDHGHHGVERIDRVLDFVGRAATPPRLSQIVAATGIPSSTVADLLAELRRHGYVHREENAYRLGRRLQVLALIAGMNPAAPISHEQLTRLSKVAESPLALAVLIGVDVLYLDIAGSGVPAEHQAIADRLEPRPALRTAAGRLLVATADRERRSTILRDIALHDPEPVTAFLRERPGIVRAQLARSDGLADPDIQAIAIPVLDSADVPAAIVLTGPRSLPGAPRASFALETAATKVLAEQRAWGPPEASG